MAVTGKTGADAISKALNRQAINVQKYGPKFNGALPDAVSTGAITSTERDIIVAFVASIPAAKSAMVKFAAYCGF